MWIVYDVILALEFSVGVVAGGFCVNSVDAVASPHSLCVLSVSVCI